MKNLTIKLMLLCVLFAFSCKDEKEQVEPSMKEMLSKEWKLVKSVSRKRVNYSAEDTFKLMLRRDGTFYLNFDHLWGAKVINGTWEVDELKKTLTLHDPASDIKEHLIPLSLTNHPIAIYKISKQDLQIGIDDSVLPVIYQFVNQSNY